MKFRILKFLDPAIEYLIYGLILCIPVSIALVSIFGGIAIVLFLIKQVLSSDFSSIKSNKTLFLFLLIFFIFMALSLINSGPLMGKSLKALFIKWGRGPLILWMILDAFRDTRRIVKAAGVFLFSAALIGFSAFSQKFFGLEFIRHKHLFGSHVTGPFTSPIALSSYLTCVIPIVLSFSLWKWKRVFIKIGFLLITVMLMMCSFWTYCRGGWVGLTAALISVALLINYSRLPKKVFWTLFAGGYIFCVPLTAIGVFFLKSDPQRIILYRGAWKMIVEHPFFGKGLGTFMDYCVQYTNNPWPCYAHNCFLQVWAESGIFSLLSFILFNGYVLYKNIKVILRASASFNSFLLIGLNAALLGFLVHSFFDIHFYSVQFSFLFWVVLGLTVALSSRLEQELLM